MTNSVEDTKKPLVGGQEGVGINEPSNVDVNKSISQNTRSKKSKSWKKQPKLLGNQQKVSNVAIKCYEEQLVNGWDFTKESIENLDSSQYQVLAIVHNRDEVTDGIWAIATEKPHLHVIFRCVDRKKRIRVKTVLNMLGIEFRQGIDDGLWANHGVESVGDFSAYANYLTHETEEAIKDNKELYSIHEIVSNLDESGIKQVRAGYTRIVADDIRVTTSELAELDKKAYALGYELGNFQLWYESLSFVIRSHSKVKTIKESYDAGVSQRVKDKSEVVRLCIFIEGEANTGKTFASEKAIPSADVLKVRGGGSGKFDNLRADVGGILIDDDVCPNLLNMTDNYPCFAYRRNNNNPVWAGDYFVVTSNKSFREWLEDCGIRTSEYVEGCARYDDTKHYEAMKSRFYICKVVPDQGVNKLKLLSPSTRGSVDDQTKRLEKFVTFRDKFNETISTYTPKTDVVDYSKVLGFGS